LSIPGDVYTEQNRGIDEATSKYVGNDGYWYYVVDHNHNLK